MKLDIDSRLFLKRKFSQKFDLISFETQFIGMFCEFKEEFNLNVYSKNKKKFPPHTQTERTQYFTDEHKSS